MEFSETVNSYDDKLTFQDMNVSRPLMKVKKYHRLNLLIFSLT